jgi:hypothetical protein
MYSFSSCIFSMFDSNFVQNDLFYQTGGNTYTLMMMTQSNTKITNYGLIGPYLPHMFKDSWDAWYPRRRGADRCQCPASTCLCIVRPDPVYCVLRNMLRFIWTELCRKHTESSSLCMVCIRVYVYRLISSTRWSHQHAKEMSSTR